MFEGLPMPPRIPGAAPSGIVWYGMVWCGMAWCAMVIIIIIITLRHSATTEFIKCSIWHSMVWYGTV